MKNILFALLIIASGASAQKTEITGTVSGGTASDTVYLLRYRAGKMFTEAKSVATRPVKFSLNVTKETSGLYYISNSRTEKDGAELIIIAGQKLQFKASLPNIQNTFELIGKDAENDAYHTFMTGYAQLDSMLYFTSQIKPDEADSLYINKILIKQARIYFGFERFRKTAGREMAPGSYVNATLKPFANFKDAQVNTMTTFNSIAWQNKHFLDHLDFSNQQILNHYLVNEYLTIYFKFFVPKTEDGIIKGIDYVYSKLPAAGPVREYLLDRMLNVFSKDKAGNVFKHLYGLLGKDDHCALNIDQSKVDKLIAAANLNTGDKMPNFNLKTTDGMPFSFTSVVTGHTETMVFVWKANCIHCLDTWKKMADNGFLNKYTGAFVAVCIDSNLMDIPQQKGGSAFYSTYDDLPVEKSELVKRLGIANTPTIFTLDKDGKITGRHSAIPGL